jgi:hypothetical protein
MRAARKEQGDRPVADDFIIAWNGNDGVRVSMCTLRLALTAGYGSQILSSGSRLRAMWREPRPDHGMAWNRGREMAARQPKRPDHAVKMGIGRERPETLGGACDYIDADVRWPDKILVAAAGMLDFAQPLAVMVLGRAAKARTQLSASGQ